MAGIRLIIGSRSGRLIEVVVVSDVFVVCEGFLFDLMRSMRLVWVSAVDIVLDVKGGCIWSGFSFP